MVDARAFEEYLGNNNLLPRYLLSGLYSCASIEQIQTPGQPEPAVETEAMDQMEVTGQMETTNQMETADQMEATDQVEATDQMETTDGTEATVVPRRDAYPPERAGMRGRDRIDQPQQTKTRPRFTNLVTPPTERKYSNNLEIQTTKKRNTI